jgi:class 3 adenylate cyclase
VTQLSSQERPPSASRAVKAERRNLTVVFCDMVGSTELSSRLDPEDMRDIMRAFQRSCETAIFGFDGRIGRYMGDGILAYFGFPAAHEDSAERAVQAALEGIRLVSELSFEGVPKIEMRVGIATGLVVVGDLIGEGSSREFALVGDAPNLAARLQQLAKPNQILVAPARRDASRRSSGARPSWRCCVTLSRKRRQDMDSWSPSAASRASASHGS